MQLSNNCFVVCCDCMKTKLHWIYGRHSVEAVLSNNTREVARVVVGNENDVLVALACSRHIDAEIMDNSFFDSVFGKNAIHQKCAALVGELPQLCVEDLLVDSSDMRPFVILDQVTDPQNIGSILRASAVFDARAVVVQDKHSPELSATSLKASSGASEFVPLIRVVNLANTIKLLQKNNFWSVGLDERGDKLLAALPSNTKYAIIIGSEGKGMRKLTKDYCDFLVKIPSNKNFSTLNAAQAATVSLYEVFKLRGR